MKIKIYNILFFLSLTYCNMALTQPSYIYEGGDGGGYSMQSDFSSNSYLFEGSTGGGYSMQSDLSGNSFPFEGSEGEGYASAKNTTPLITQFGGGSNDGYIMVERCEDFTWKGTVGTGWAVSGNWNYNTVPNLKRRAIIPPGVPSFPFVNAGIFAIGENPNNGAFKCRELWIKDGALLVTRINNFVENYGNIIIDGTMQVKKSSFDAFQNFGNGVVRISPTGLLLIKP